jgi:hypothetical protein
MDIFPPAKQRPALLALRDALGCRDNALRRDECGDWRINGKQGHVYAVPEGFQLVFFAREGVTEWDGAGPHIEDYRRAKRDLIFCRLAQDGTGEGTFFLGRLPTPTEAEIIRGTLMIAKKREAGDPSAAQLAARTAFAERRRAEVAARTDFAPEQTFASPEQQTVAAREDASRGAGTANAPARKENASLAFSDQDEAPGA